MYIFIIKPQAERLMSGKDSLLTPKNVHSKEEAEEVLNSQHTGSNYLCFKIVPVETAEVTKKVIVE